MYQLIGINAYVWVNLHKILNNTLIFKHCNFQSNVVESASLITNDVHFKHTFVLKKYIICLYVYVYVYNKLI